MIAYKISILILLVLTGVALCQSDDGGSDVRDFFGSIFKGISSFFEKVGEKINKASEKWSERIGHVFDKIGNFFLFKHNRNETTNSDSEDFAKDDDEEYEDEEEEIPMDVEISPNDKHVSKYIGESYDVSCHPHKSVWTSKTFNSSKADRSQNGHIRIEHRTRSNDLKLQLSDLDENDSGVYNCSGEKHVQGFNLTVLKRIAFINNISVQIPTKANEDFTVICGAKGNGEVNITWEVDGVKIYQIPDEEMQTMEWKKYVVNNESNLIIRNVEKEDNESRFNCTATEYILPGFTSANSTIISIDTSMLMTNGTMPK